MTPRQGERIGPPRQRNRIAPEASDSTHLAQAGLAVKNGEAEVGLSILGPEMVVWLRRAELAGNLARKTSGRGVYEREDRYEPEDRYCEVSAGRCGLRRLSTSPNLTGGNP